jgi:hypothetical protein
VGREGSQSYFRRREMNQPKCCFLPRVLIHGLSRFVEFHTLYSSLIEFTLSFFYKVAAIVTCYMLNGMPLSIFNMIVVLYIEERVWLQIKRLHLLLTERESAMDVPENLEARRRIAFFTNSLFMNMPRAPRVRNMLSFRCVKFLNEYLAVFVYRRFNILINILDSIIFSK